MQQSAGRCVTDSGDAEMDAVGEIETDGLGVAETDAVLEFVADTDVLIVNVLVSDTPAAETETD